MFSERTRFDLRPNELSLLTAERKNRGLPLFDLTLSNPTRAGFRYPEERILSAISNPSAMTYCPDPAGLLPARQAVARLYAGRGLEISPDDVVLTSSTSEAYSFLFRLLADPGDSILVPCPSYPLFQYLARLDGVEALSYPLYYTDEWMCDLDALSDLAQRSRARAILVVHPNNPTGSYFRDLDRLGRIADETGAAVVCDEVFFDFALADGPIPDPAGLTGNSLTFVLNGLSKTLALPQLKLSWILLRGPAGLKRAARERLELIGDTFLSVNSAVQHALPELLEMRGSIQPSIMGRLQDNLAALREACHNTAVRLLEPEGGWYAVLRLPPWHGDDEFALELLRGPGVLVHPGSFFGFAGSSFLVISLLPENDTFIKGLRGILDLA